MFGGEVEAHREDGDQDMLREKEGDDAWDGADREKPGGGEDGCRRQDYLPKAKVDALEGTFVADGGRRQRWDDGSHEPIIVAAERGFQSKIMLQEPRTRARSKRTCQTAYCVRGSS